MEVFIMGCEMPEGVMGLEQLHEVVCQGALAQLQREGRVMPHLYILREGSASIMPLIYRNDEEKYFFWDRVIPEVIRKFQVKVISFVSESWTVEKPITPGDDITVLSKKIPKPSQHPDRQEILLVVTTDGEEVVAAQASFLIVEDRAQVDEFKQMDEVEPFIMQEARKALVEVNG